MPRSDQLIPFVVPAKSAGGELITLVVLATEAVMGDLQECGPLLVDLAARKNVLTVRERTELMLAQREMDGHLSSGGALA